MMFLFHGRFGTGWKPDIFDFHDHLLVLKPGPVPSTTDLRDKCPEIYDQGQLGSCTGNGIAGLLEFDRIKQGLSAVVPSRLFIYYCERSLEGTVDSDSGAMIRDGLKSVAKFGACHETTWPYDISQFTVKPSDTAYTEALNNQAVEYRRLRNGDMRNMKLALASGFPFTFGVPLYESFQEAATNGGMVPTPQWGEKLLGGHCMDIVGHNDPGRVYVVRNSWGPDWGDKGYCYMPYDYIQQMASDQWNVTMVEPG